MSNTHMLEFRVNDKVDTRIQEMRKELHGITTEELARRAFSLLSLAIQAEREGKSLIIQGADPSENERIKVR